MSHFAHRRVWLVALVGATLGVAGLAKSQAQETRTIVVPAATGYGVEECLDAGSDCGAIVANAWCNAYGEGVAVEFGRYEADKSGAARASWPAPKRYYVDCSEAQPR